MIEFRGSLSDKAKRFLSHKIINMGILIITVAFTTILIPILMLCFLLNYWYILIGYVFSYGITLLVGCFYWRFSKAVQLSIPERIVFDRNKILSYTAQGQIIQHCDDVKRVIDYGDWYYLEFAMGKKSFEFICQKNLIVSGTLEEFESLLIEKIVKKHGH